MATRCVAVAWSGGHDSTALLHATLYAAAPLGLRVVALHVHHGLSPLADDWVCFCERQVGRWARAGHDVSLHVEHLGGRPARGESVEAWARQERYRALRRLAVGQGAQVVLLAHHRRDQAETFLIQALRGAGVAGLSGMPASVERDGLHWCRPWLDRPAQAIDAYVRHHRLRHIDDDSNADPRFARNRLRMQVWPALLEAFPDAEGPLAASAAWAREADACLRALAAQDLATAETPRGLRIAALAALAAERRSNVLRHWLHAQTGRRAPASLLQRLSEELRPGHAARWPVPGGELRAYRGLLRHEALADPAAPAAPAPESHLSIAGEGTHALPGWKGELVVRRVEEGGVPLAWLARLDLRPRQGAERFQAGIGRPPRSLKKQFQAAAVPAWQRHGPLIYSGGQLVYVPGLGLDARVIGLPGQPLATLDWQPLR